MLDTLQGMKWVLYWKHNSKSAREQGKRATQKQSTYGPIWGGGKKLLWSWWGKKG